MVLCEKKMMDGKCRVQIPTAYILEAGGNPDGIVYIFFDKETREIKITVKKETEETKCVSKENRKW